MPFVTIHAFTDLFLTKGADLKMHHLSVLGVLFYNFYYNVSEADRFPIIYSLLKTEISSIFYVLHLFTFQTPIIYNKNKIEMYIIYIKIYKL